MDKELEKMKLRKQVYVMRVEHKRLDYFTVYDDILAYSLGEAENIARSRFKEFGGKNIFEFKVTAIDPYKYMK